MNNASEIRDYLADATAKLAALPARVEEEKQQAASEYRLPRPIIPLTQVRAPVVGELLAGIETVPPDSQEMVDTLRRVCREHPAAVFAMKSEQVIALVALAGIKPNA